jgi:hypothetical protein
VPDGGSPFEPLLDDRYAYDEEHHDHDHGKHSGEQ